VISLAAKKTEKKPSIQQQLVDSNIQLQSKLVDLVESNNNVSKQLAQTSKDISSMTDFFKEAGKYMVAETEDEKLKPLLNKIGDLVDQNKTIMRGLMLVQKYMKSAQTEDSKLFPE
jgi:predicted  nucleic acid-binding Zn-ribbon protein